MCIPNAYSLVPASKLFIEKGDEVSFIYPGTLEHFKYRYEIDSPVILEKDDSISKKEGILFSTASTSIPKKRPEALCDALPIIDFNVSRINPVNPYESLQYEKTNVHVHLRCPNHVACRNRKKW